MRSSMMTHMRTHSHHKGFRCEQCNKSFSSAGVLNYHQKYVYSLENRHLFIDTCFFCCIRQWHFSTSNTYIRGGYGNALLREKQPENSKSAGIKPSNTRVQGCDASQYATEKPVPTFIKERVTD